MSLNSIINEAIDNPPMDGEEPLEEVGTPTSPIAHIRHAALMEMANTGEVDEEHPGARFGIDKLNAENASAVYERLKAEAIATWREQAAAVEQQVHAARLALLGPPARHRALLRGCARGRRAEAAGPPAPPGRRGVRGTH